MHAHPALAVLLALSSCSFTASDEGFSFQIGGEPRYRATLEHELALELSGSDRLVLEGIPGDVTVRAVADVAPRLSARITAAAESQQQADEAARQVRLEPAREGDALVIAVVGVERNGPRVAVETDLEALVPHGVSVRIQSAAGEIKVVGPVGAVDARTSFGDVAVERAGGDVRAKSASGEVELSEVEGGRVVAETDFGDVALATVRADEVTASSSSGDVTLSAVRAGAISATSRFGDVEIRDVEGDVTAETASGRLELRNAAQGTHVVHSGFGDVEVEAARGLVRASSASGDVEVRQAAGEVRAKSGFGGVEVSGVLAQVDAESSSGDVAVRAEPGSAATADWRVVSRFGAVGIALPDGFGCELELLTAFGGIESELALDRRDQAGPGDRGGARIGAGGPRVVLETASGDVEVRVQR